jgi:hypothetical protein
VRESLEPGPLSGTGQTSVTGFREMPYTGRGMGWGLPGLHHAWHCVEIVAGDVVRDRMIEAAVPARGQAAQTSQRSLISKSPLAGAIGVKSVRSGLRSSNECHPDNRALDQNGGLFNADQQNNRRPDGVGSYGERSENVSRNAVVVGL